MIDEPPDTFAEACGLIGPLRVHLEGAELPDLIPMEVRRPFLVVGRDRVADITIDSPKVSRRHAYFQVVAGRVLCVDLSSRTGVGWEDGARPVGWVDRDRGVDVGPVRVRIGGDLAPPEGEGGPLPISRSFEWSTLPEARLDFLEGESGRESWQVSRPLTLLGRSPTCRLKLAGPGVGKVHAALLRTPSGVWVVDLMGPGGVLVGGEPTRAALLEDGDEIGLGGHRIRIRIGQPARPSARSNLARMPGIREARPVPTRAGLPADLDEVALGRPGPSGGVDPLTTRLLDEFNRMHQRTTEQFQQVILMMFRMHQDQMEVIRDELSRLDRLEDEQRLLQAELARVHSSQPSRLALRLVSGEPSSENPGDIGVRSPRPEPAKSPGFSQTNAPNLTIPPSGVGDSTSPPTDPDPHARLARRIAAIQDERQGLWQKLFASLTGESLEKGVL